MTETKPEKFRERDVYSYAQVEGALCAWEWVLGNAEKEPMKSYFEGVGSAGMRMASIQAGDICDRAYKHMEAHGYEFVGSYDWEFVPAVLTRIDWNTLINDNQWNGPAYEPDIDAIFTAIFAADKAQSSPDLRRFAKNDTLLAPLDRWLERARIEARKQWAYAELIDDHIERAQEAHKAEQDPAEFVKWLGEKYDLIPVGGW